MGASGLWLWLYRLCGGAVLELRVVFPIKQREVSFSIGSGLR